MQRLVFRYMEGQDLRQTMVTIGLSIVFADLMLWVFGGDFYQISTPPWLVGPVDTPFVTAVKSSGEATRFLLDSLVVVILGGMGSIPGAALGAVIVGLAEQLGSVYIPSYAIVVTFLIMVLVLAVRPQGLISAR